jgi:AAA+ superfamily predicted ATPase
MIMSPSQNFTQEVGSESWVELNQRNLMAAIDRVKTWLIQHFDQLNDQDTELSHPALLKSTITDSSAISFSLVTLCNQFNLDDFERDILLLCAGIELDSQLSKICSAIDPQHPYPTFSLALAGFAEPTWNALTPQAPLRHWQLLDIGPGNALTTSPLRIDERILHYLTGIDELDQRLVGLVEPIETEATFLVETHQRIADRLVDLWIQAAEQGMALAQFPVLQLLGDDSLSKREIIQFIGQELGRDLYRIPAETIATDSTQFNLFVLLCEREYKLTHRVFWVDCDFLDSSDGIRAQLAARLVEQLKCPVILTHPDRQRQRSRSIVTVEIIAPTPAEQRLVWQKSLDAIQVPFNQDQIGRLVDHFNLSTSAIQSAAFQLRSAHLDQIPMSDQLWRICRQQARPRLDELAQRIDAYGDWDDLVLPEKEHQVLRDITAHVKQRSQVYENWGFAGKSLRGLGISALFSGASGTGKTTAAEAIAQVLNLDIYRVDLSAVVSKYIGETEKNLRRIFDAAEGGGVILLFDEADSLFGKRSEVKDSHDRNANMEVSYLLQRMETYRGLAILTTNLKGSIDQAFMRRIRFIVQFPFPDAIQRAEIWRRSFPKQTPIEDLDFDKLAKLSIAGGNIRNIALNAAFIAADSDEAVQMKHILRSAKSEYVKLERPLTDAEIKGWV